MTHLDITYTEFSLINAYIKIEDPCRLSVIYSVCKYMQISLVFVYGLLDLACIKYF